MNIRGPHLRLWPLPLPRVPVLSGVPCCDFARCVFPLELPSHIVILFWLSVCVEMLCMFTVCAACVVCLCKAVIQMSTLFPYVYFEF